MKKSGSDVATPRTFAFVSLGCPKNLVDSERHARQADTGRLCPRAGSGRG